MDSLRDIAIVGAGPYGLSLAAHLATYGLDSQIFGTPMEAWRMHMPEGMMLKSEGFASNLADPELDLTLGRYCKNANIPYADLGMPVPRSTFAAYGLEFQKRFAPSLDPAHVAGIHRLPAGFEVELADGRRMNTRKVVLAVGLTYFHHLPSVLSHLPEQLVTHSSRHSRFEQFRGRKVVVLGGGASAMDIAAGLIDAGAEVQIVARKPKVLFHNGPSRRSWLDQIRAPMNGLGPGWRSLACVEAPLLFRLMPDKFRLEVSRRHLGPAAGWTTKAQVQGKVPFHLGYQVAEASTAGERVNLKLAHSDGTHTTLSVDHVISATGFRVDVNRLPFLSSELKSGIRTLENTPILSSHFESSIPGLYFTGLSAVASFGPLLRFVYGTRFMARRLSRHLAANGAKVYVPGVTTETA
jgi:cation diffusion facilitator CzcD-associated flavoprotein CzcO